MTYTQPDTSVLGRAAVWVLDLDGVVYAGAEALPGAVDAIRDLRAAGRRVVFLTNNSARSPAQIAEKLRRLGIPCDAGEVVTSGSAAAEWLASRPGVERVHVLGTDALAAEVASRGLRLVDAGPADAVLVGLDPAFSYEKLAAAFLVAREAPLVVACNRDRDFPGDRGVPRPGCAAMVGALEAALGREVDAVVGKPSTHMLELLAARLGVRVADCCVVGDGLDSDVRMALDAGVPAVWITGDTTLASVVRETFGGTGR